MMTLTVIFLFLASQLVLAHFSIDYPYWRDNSFNSPYSQYVYPCAGVNQSASANNRTLWPLKGGSLQLNLHHPWTYVFVNLGLGSNVSTNFNISLTPQFLNETGNGTLCIPQVIIPAGLVTDGQNASIQVVTNGDSGSSLYNCADITFSSSAVLLSSNQCKNDTEVSASVVPGSSGTSSSSSTNSSSSPSASATKSGTSPLTRTAPLWLTVGVVGLVALVL